MKEYENKRKQGELDDKLGKMWAPGYKWKCSDQGKGNGPSNSKSSTASENYYFPIHNVYQ